MELRILYCEDEADTASIVRSHLEHAGHHVDYAATADQGVALFDVSLLPTGKRYQLVITDIEMVGHTGLFFASWVRTRGFDGPIAVLTAHTQDRYETLIRDVGGVYWGKPESVNRLAELVEALMAQQPVTA